MYLKVKNKTIKCRTKPKNVGATNVRGPLRSFRVGAPNKPNTLLVTQYTIGLKTTRTVNTDHADIIHFF